MAQRSSRKRRKERQRARPDGPPMADRYARSRAKDEAARAALEPLPAGERPTAVTVGAIVAAVLAVAQAVAFGLGYSPGAGERNVGAVIGVILVGTMAWGMWRTRYWAVLGMQTLLGITILYASLAAIFAANWQALVLVFAIVVPASTLFWFLIKAMARIQMPERPGAQG